MTQVFTIHPTHPQQRLLDQAADIVAAGGLVVFPTDTTYALGCRIGDKQALERIRTLRALDRQHFFTLTCRDLSEIAVYARVDNANYRVLKHLTPGPFTFLLPATREVPRRLVHPKRRTIGLRVPDNQVTHALLGTIAEPLMSTTMRLPGDEHALSDPQVLRERLAGRVDLIICSDAGGFEPTTVVDLTGDAPTVVRQGRGEFV